MQPVHPPSKAQSLTFLTVGRGRRTKPPGFWDCLSNNSAADEIWVTGVIPCRALTPLSITGTQLKADALLVVGQRHHSYRRDTASTAHRKGVELGRFRSWPCPTTSRASHKSFIFFRLNFLICKMEIIIVSLS